MSSKSKAFRASSREAVRIPRGSARGCFSMKSLRESIPSRHLTSKSIMEEKKEAMERYLFLQEDKCEEDSQEIEDSIRRKAAGPPLKACLWMPWQQSCYKMSRELENIERLDRIYKIITGYSKFIKAKPENKLRILCAGVIPPNERLDITLFRCFGCKERDQFALVNGKWYYISPTLEEMNVVLRPKGNKYMCIRCMLTNGNRSSFLDGFEMHSLSTPIECEFRERRLLDDCPSFGFSCKCGSSSNIHYDGKTWWFPVPNLEPNKTKAIILDYGIGLNGRRFVCPECVDRLYYCL